MNEEKIIINKINTGYTEPEFLDSDYIFGSGQAPDPIINESGQWPAVEEETQIKNYDLFNCTGFATLTPVEILLRHQGIFANYSDRFLGIVAGTYPPGNDPGKVVEALRKNGAIAETLLPFSDDLKNVSEYYSFKGANEADCRNAGKEWLRTYFYKHDWIDPYSNEISKKVLIEALKRSPLSVAVFAWAKKGEKYFRPDGERDTHLTTLIGYKENEYWIVLDSYSPFIKHLEWDFKFYTAKRHFIRLLTQEEKETIIRIETNIPIWQKMINWIFEAIGLLKKQELENNPPVIPAPQESTPETKPGPPKSKIEIWAKAIEVQEGWF